VQRIINGAASATPSSLRARRRDDVFVQIKDNKRYIRSRCDAVSPVISLFFFSSPSFPSISACAYGPYARILRVSCEILSRSINESARRIASFEIFGSGCGAPSRDGRSHPFENVNRAPRFRGRARADAEISAVPRRDLPHNDARSPSSMNAPIFPFNKLMP